MAAENTPLPSEGIFSILDTDLYKLSMQCAVHRHFPTTTVDYRLNNRTPLMKLSADAFDWLKTQVSKLSTISITPDELQWLRHTCTYLSQGDYLSDFLPRFRFNPASQVTMNFQLDEDRPGYGDLDLHIHGLWQDTILYEIPLLALVSEAYFRFVDTDWTYDGQEKQAFEKGSELLKHGAVFIEFGTRRRRDYKTQDMVLKSLIEAASSVQGQKEGTSSGKFTGTSNVHFAMKHGMAPSGTMAHEWFMGIAAATQDYKNATKTALTCWTECFGKGVLAVALTDSFGTPIFLDTFKESLPAQLSPTTLANGSQQTFADIFAGVRQDSGDPKAYIKLMRNFYDSIPQVIDKRTIVFSDSLTVDNALIYKRLAEEQGFNAAFGIGTFLTNDFLRKSKPTEKSKPMNIVIKITSADGRPAVKLSDDLGKNTGDSTTISHVKEELGYIDHKWRGADESDRYGDASRKANK